MFEKIVIIGGSIAGLATAALFTKIKGCKHLTVLEGSSGLIKEKNGTGITLPFSLIQECIKHNLLDKNIPLFPATSRSFSVKNHDDSEQESTKFWQQDLEVVTLNWKHVYENIFNRVDPAIYHSHSKVTNIHKVNDGYLVETIDGRCFEADLIIAADGCNSRVRKSIIPEVAPKYSGYIAWRGVVELSEQEILNGKEQIPYYVFNNGHILLYQIPDATYHQTGKVLLNWVLYETFSESHLQDFLIDKNGIKHTASLPAGSLGTKHLNHLQALITRNLPNHINSFINRTEDPFIQVVQDFQLPDYVEKNIIFVGDAALTLRPHTASGLLKALKNSLDLCKLFRNTTYESPEELVTTWKEQQKKIASEEINKSRIMGQYLVLDTPDWEKMNQKSMDLWWNNIMTGMHWYAVTASVQSIFTPTTDNCYLADEDKNNIQMAKL